MSDFDPQKVSNLAAKISEKEADLARMEDQKRLLEEAITRVRSELKDACAAFTQAVETRLVKPSAPAVMQKEKA